MLGKVYLRTGDNARAKEELEATLRLDPSDTDTQHRLAQLEQSKPAPTPNAPK